MTVALVTAATAIVTAFATALINSWLQTREQTAESLRQLRLDHYPAVWKLTSQVSIWPRQQLSSHDVMRLHRDLRAWYYNDGGLYLSENARERYGHLQEGIAAYVDSRTSSADIAPADYGHMMELASDFRHGLTEDLETRRKRSLIWTLQQSLGHRKQAREAKAHISALKS
jgi:hypothetical protein